jgi:hypothetical protein
MTEMEELEMELRSLPLRRPSAKLERYLFREHAPGSTAAVHPTRNRQPAPPLRLSWLAPAMAALLLMCVLFNPRNSSTVAGSASPGPMVAMMMSNQTLAAFLPANSQNEQNILRNTFERTNISRSTPDIAPLSH